MSESKKAAYALQALESLVNVDPESLPLGAAPSYRFRYIDIASATNGKLLLPDDAVEYRDAPSRARRVIRNGDVLMSTVRPNLKAFAYCRLPPGDFVASTGFAVLRAKEGTDPQFVLYSILSDDVTQQIERYVVGSNYPAINSSDVKRLLIRQLSPAHQKRIAEILSTVDEAIEQTVALIAKTQQIKAGLMHDLFTRGVTPDGQLRPPRDEAPHLYKESPLGWIPKEWHLKTTVGCASTAPGSTTIGPFGSNLLASDYRPTGVPIVFVRDVKKNRFEWNSNVYITPEKAASLTAHAVRSGDIVATKMGLPPCVACRYPDWMLPGVVTADIIRLRPDPTVVDARWLSAAINNDSVSRQVQSITAGVTRPKVTLADFRRLRLACPQIDEQVVIGDRLAAIDEIIDTELARLKKLKKQKHGLMHDLLTGRVRVKVSDPAST